MPSSQVVRTRITRLRHYLIQADEPQYVIASSCRITPTKLSNYALGKEPIAQHHLVRLCQYFSCDPKDLLGYIEAEDIIKWTEEGSTNGNS